VRSYRGDRIQRVIHVQGEAPKKEFTREKSWGQEESGKKKKEKSRGSSKQRTHEKTVRGKARVQ
jgi:hypothetical protein